MAQVTQLRHGKAVPRLCVCDLQHSLSSPPADPFGMSWEHLPQHVMAWCSVYHCKASGAERSDSWIPWNHVCACTHVHVYVYSQERAEINQAYMCLQDSTACPQYLVHVDQDLGGKVPSDVTRVRARVWLGHLRWSPLHLRSPPSQVVLWALWGPAWDRGPEWAAPAAPLCPSVVALQRV